MKVTLICISDGKEANKQHDVISFREESCDQSASHVMVYVSGVSRDLPLSNQLLKVHTT